MALPPYTAVQSQSLRGIIPVGISLQDWADRTTGIVQRFGFNRRLMGDDDLVDWGMDLVQNLAQVKGGQIPRPDQYADWRDWALAVNRKIES